MLVLAVSITASSVWYIGHALSATNRNSIIPPGGMTKPCAYTIFVDGSNYDLNDCNTGDVVFTSSDAAVAINQANTLLAGAGGIIHLQSGQFNLNSPIILTNSNVYLEGEGFSADNAASNPNAAFQGTILFATNLFPAGPSLANPHYMIYVGGNGLFQMQGGGIKDLSLANARGFSSGNIGGIAMGFALKTVVDSVSFGGFKQSSGTDYNLDGPALAFDATLSNATQGGPNGGWFLINHIFVNKDGGEEMLRFNSLTISDTWIENSVFFGPAFGNGIVYGQDLVGVRFDNDMFYNIGVNNAPGIWATGTITGLSVTNSEFEQQSINAGAGNNIGFIQLKITGDDFIDGFIGVNFLDNSFLVYSSITIPVKYFYQVNQTTANCPIHELGDIVNDLSGTATTYLSNNVVANQANVVFEIPSLAIGTTLPAIRGPISAGTSPFTYTDNDGYPEWFNLVATNGMTGMTWRGVIVPTTASLNYLLNPGDSMVLTWTTTAPTYKIVPAAIAI